MIEGAFFVICKRQAEMIGHLLAENAACVQGEDFDAAGHGAAFPAIVSTSTNSTHQQNSTGRLSDGVPAGIFGQKRVVSTQNKNSASTEL